MSRVWKFFIKDEKEKFLAKCKQCPKTFKCAGSSTSSLLYHLRNVHNLDLSENEPVATTAKKSKLTSGPMEKYMKLPSLSSVEEIIT